MTWAASTLAFPLLLAALALGVGLIVERLSSRRLPGFLVLPLGFAALVDITQLGTSWRPVAPLTPWLVLVLAALGFFLARGRLRTVRLDVWKAAPPLVTYAIVAAPVLLAFRATFPGYLLDTTGAIQLMGADRLLEFGRGLAASSSTSYGETLGGYFGRQYPSGAHTVLASASRLLHVEMLWTYAPFLGVALALATCVLVFLAQSAGVGRPAAAVVGVFAAVPALVYSYALMGSIKEIALLPTLLLLGALLLCRGLRGQGLRAWLPLAVTGAAGLATIGLAFLPWLVLVALTALVIELRSVQPRLRLRALAKITAAFAGATALLALPTIAALGASLRLANSLSTSNQAAVNDPGNLLRPLLNEQAFGVWLGPTHRLDPQYLRATYLLIGVTAIAILFGAVWTVRRRAWSLLVYMAISVVVWWLLTQRGTAWTDAKLLVLISPVLLLAGGLGAASLLKRRRLEGLAVLGLISFGVLASDALSYRATNLAPTDRFLELRTLGQHFAGRGPALTPDFDEYAMYLLRRLGNDAPGYAFKGRAGTLVTGGAPSYGTSYDLDQLPLATLERYPTIIARRSPAQSRPPASFQLAYQGRWYDVWTRRSHAPVIVRHIPLGSGLDHLERPPCREVEGLARSAERAHEQLIAARAPDLVVKDAQRSQHTVGFVPSSIPGTLNLTTPGRAEVGLRVGAAGVYRLWLLAQIDRKVNVSLDGKPVGRLEDETGGQGNAALIGVVHLSAGSHVVSVSRSGGSLRPGDTGASSIAGMALEAVTPPPGLITVKPGSRRSICGRPLDWLELVRRGGALRVSER